MAVAAEQTGPVDAIGRCCVCVRPFEDPRLLPCLHTICKHCLDELSVSAVHSGQLACPLCSAVCRLPDNGTAGLPVNFLALSGEDSWEITQPDQRCCMLCEEDNPVITKCSAWCENCSRPLCDKHILPHIVATGTTRHSVISLEAAQAQRSTAGGTGRHRPGKADDAPKCRLHGQPLRLFCAQCDVAICGECSAVGDHKRHGPAVYLAEVFEQRKTDAFRQLSELQVKTAGELQQSIHMVDAVRIEVQQRAGDASEGIRKASRLAVHTVEAHAVQMLQDVDDSRYARLRALDEQYDELKRNLDETQAAIKFGERLVAQDTGNQNSIGLLQAFARRAAGLQGLQTAIEPNANSSLLFTPASGDDVLHKAKEIIGHVFTEQASVKHSLPGSRKKRRPPYPEGIGIQLEEFESGSLEPRVFDRKPGRAGYSSESTGVPISQQPTHSSLPGRLHQAIIGRVSLEIVRGNIVNEHVDAIVNTTGEGLSNCGGVTFTIAKAAGHKVQQECDKIAFKTRLRVGEAVITGAGHLPCHQIIHTVGPMWGTMANEKAINKLKEACVNTLALANRHNIQSISFPAISAGIRGMPKETCAHTMLTAIRDFCLEMKRGSVSKVRLVICDPSLMAAFRFAFEEVIVK